MSGASPSPVGRWFAVVPAAGRSVRMGEPKLLLDVPDGGRPLPMIEKVLRVWQRVQPTPAAVVITVHPDDEALAQLCREAGAEVVQPVVPPPDMKASITAALEYLRDRYQPTISDIWLTAPADLPELSSCVIEKLLQVHDTGAQRILRPAHRGRFGHPTLWPWSCAAELTSIPADRGLDYLFERMPYGVVEAGSESVVADVDTPEDYRRLRDR